MCYVKRCVGLAGALAVGSVVAAPAGGAIVLADRFTDGGATAGADALDTSWFATSTSTNAGAVVVVDAGLPARGEANDNVLRYTQGTTFKALIGGFATQTFTAVGDSITLTFDFRYQAAPGGADNLRFGLHYDNGTPVTGNGTTQDNDDDGYYATVTSGTSKSYVTWREDGATGGVAAGTDRAQIGLANTLTPSPVGDGTGSHTASMTLTRTAAGLTIATSVDGVTLQSVSETNPVSLQFNQVSISTVNYVGQFHVDNVVVDAVVPEPGLVGLGAIPAMYLLGGRRARRR